MLTVNLFDSEFPGQPCSVNGRTPRLVEYVRDRLEFDGITVFTDRRIYSGEVAIVRSRVKVAWLLEGRCLRPHYYDNIDTVSDYFDYILTTDPDLLSRGGKYIPIIRGGAWTPVEQWGVYPKSRGVSLILSSKCCTPGHKLRHAIADRFGDRIDVFRETPKVEALRDYKFSICVEACYAPNWFSEHLLDCIAYGTTPIYWGCPNLDAYVTGAVIPFRDLDELEGLLNWADTAPHPWIRASHFTQAIDRAKPYEITDDWIAENVYLPLLAGVTV